MISYLYEFNFCPVAMLLKIWSFILYESISVTLCELLSPSLPTDAC